MSRIGLIGDNSVQYIDKLLEIWEKGNCAVLIDWRIPYKTALELINEAGVTECFVEKKWYEKFHETDYKFETNNVLFIVYCNTNSNVMLLPIDYYRRFIPDYSDNAAVILYSSGTTGNSKGIILSHFAINTNADAIIDYMKPSNNDCIFIVKAISHASTLVGEFLVALKCKIKLLISPTFITPRSVFKNINEFKVTILCLNPTLLNLYYNYYIKSRIALSTLKTIYVSGSILSETLYNKIKLLNGINVYNVYGLSEAGPRVTAQRFDCSKTNSVGKCILGVKVLIMTKEGTLKKSHIPGGVFISSPSIFSGYVNTNNNHKFFGNWLNSGDLGYFNNDDELVIIGRQDNMIVNMGHNIFPETIEQVIINSGLVDECVVYLRKIQNEKEEVYQLACKYTACKEVSYIEFVKACKLYLADYEIPKSYVYVDRLLKSPNGKIYRNNIEG